MLNAGAAIYAAGLADTLDAGIRKADTEIATGKAKEKLDALVSYQAVLNKLSLFSS